MLRFVHAGPSLTRREWLRIGGLAGLSLVRPAACAAAPRHAPGFGRARSVIFVYASGGQSQIDTWDPKPEAPAEVRGAFRPVATSVPGTFVCEHLPRLARLAHRYTIVRSLAHDDLDHGSAGYLALTGRFHPRKSSNPPPAPTDFPTYGAIVRRLRPGGRMPYAAVHLNGPALIPERVGPGQFAGFLGRSCEPLLLGDVTAGPAPIPGLEPLLDLPPVRLQARRALLDSLDDYRRQLAADRRLLDLNVTYRQAYELLAAPECRRAFDLDRESAAVRARYGLHRSGQAYLLARRLVEAGVPFVTVIANHSNRGQDKSTDPDAYGWDTHNDIFESLRHHLLPRFDQSFSALLEDLAQRGLLERTLVVCVGEFGRAPQVALEARFAGSSPGRKHWAAVYSAVLAGAGVADGGVYGSSDRQGAYPRTQPTSPGDLAATLFHALGIDPAREYHDPAGRPFQVAEGRPLAGLYA